MAPRLVVTEDEVVELGRMIARGEITHDEAEAILREIAVREDR